MKKKILYVCDYCHTQYKDEITAQVCERNHKQKLKIVGTRYLPATQGGSELPVTITVENEFGNQAIYKR